MPQAMKPVFCTLYFTSQTGWAASGFVSCGGPVTFDTDYASYKDRIVCSFWPKDVRGKSVDPPTPRTTDYGEYREHTPESLECFALLELAKRGLVGVQITKKRTHEWEA